MKWVTAPAPGDQQGVWKYHGNTTLSWIFANKINFCRVSHIYLLLVEVQVPRNNVQGNVLAFTIHIHNYFYYYACQTLSWLLLVSSWGKMPNLCFISVLKHNVLLLWMFLHSPQMNGWNICSSKYSGCWFIGPFARWCCCPLRMFLWHAIKRHRWLAPAAWDVLTFWVLQAASSTHWQTL